VAIGTATATAVRVGNAVGRRERAGLGRAGWVGLGLGITLMLCLIPVLHGSSSAVARVYTADAAVVAIAAPGPVLAAWILLADASRAS
jgi:multidrug resistance protein, MATE family